MKNVDAETNQTDKADYYQQFESNVKPSTKVRTGKELHI